jgi:hypothetical protein
VHGKNVGPRLHDDQRLGVEALDGVVLFLHLAEVRSTGYSGEMAQEYQQQGATLERRQGNGRAVGSEEGEVGRRVAEA